MRINEIYEAFQGEGKTLGMPAVFLRMALCNLACIWCDTAYTWNWLGSNFKHPEKYNKNEEILDLSVIEIANRLAEYRTKRLIITGGEPMLQQKELIELLKILKNNAWKIEIETNGTIVPTSILLDLVDQINCSPKFSNSGSDNPLHKRIVPKALRKLTECDKTNFKLVICELEDIENVPWLIKSYGIDPSRIYLMPEGKTRITQELRQEDIRALCRKYGFNFTPRLHILLFDNRRGV